MPSHPLPRCLLAGAVPSVQHVCFKLHNFAFAAGKRRTEGVHPLQSGHTAVSVGPAGESREWHQGGFEASRSHPIHAVCRTLADDTQRAGGRPLNSVLGLLGRGGSGATRTEGERPLPSSFNWYVTIRLLPTPAFSQQAATVVSARRASGVNVQKLSHLGLN